jgi:hypothetical protein
MNTIPILYVGMTGIGKTAKIHQEFDYVEVLLASCMTEEDIAGIPYREGLYDQRTVPAIFKNLHEAANKGMTTALFFDELDKARRSVADTLLTLIASRKIGNSILPESTAIVAAANPPEWGGGDGVSDAMLSRFAIIEAKPNVQEWCNWARKNFAGAEACLAVIEAVERGLIPIADVTGEDFNKRITSPRTLTMALEAIRAKNKNYSLLVKGLLTPACASTFLNLVEGYDTELEEKSATVRRLAATKTTKPIRL